MLLIAWVKASRSRNGDLRATLSDWLGPLLTADSDDGARARRDATAFVRTLKHRLNDTDLVTEHLRPDAPPYQLSRVELDRFADPALRWLVASCRTLLARAGLGLPDLDAVVLVGGGSRMACVTPALHSGIGRPVLHAPDPELAVIRGTGHWAATVTGSRHIPADVPSWQAIPLSWPVPDGSARFVRWLVDEGRPYPKGAPLAQVRASDDRVYELTASADGVLLEQRTQPGVLIDSTTVAAMARPATTPDGAGRDASATGVAATAASATNGAESRAGAAAQPTMRYRLRTAGDWLLTPDLTYLMEYAHDGSYATLRAVANGAVLKQLEPEHAVGPRGGRVFVSQAGRPTLVSWDERGCFQVWDVGTGTLVTDFRDKGDPAQVLVDETSWRLVAETGKTVQVGRYRRHIATVWDLATGTVVTDLTIPSLNGGGLSQHLDGYVERSKADGFSPTAQCSDGRLTAAAVSGGGAVPGDAGAMLALYAATTPDGGETGGGRLDGHEAGGGGSVQEVFRATESAARSVRVAFSADGTCLLAHWRGDDGGWVDVWQL